MFLLPLQRKSFIAIDNEQEVPALANEVVQRWITRVPSGILSLVSGTDLFHTWKRDDYRSALQTGIVKVIRSGSRSTITRTTLSGFSWYRR